MANSGIKIQILHDNNAAFSGIILSSGEPAYAIDNGVFKIGDGSTVWGSLSGVGGSTGGGGGVELNHSFFRIRNVIGAPLYKGQAVYASGVHANGIIQPNLYVANGAVREVRFIGLVLEDVLDNNNGYALQFGHIENIDTRGNVAGYFAVGDETWAAGDILYVHPTQAGKLTIIEPIHSISVAIVLEVASNGRLFVRPTSYGHLNDNHDISLSGVTHNDVLVYNSGTSLWENNNEVVLSQTAGITGASGVNNIVVMTSGAYSTLGLYDQNTIYFIT